MASTRAATTTSGPAPLLLPGRPDAGAARARTEELYARHGRMVEGLCRGVLRHAAEAEDAAQQTFLSAHRALLGGAEPSEPAAWLATIARNECLARVREGMRRPLPVEGVEGGVAMPDPLAEAIRRADFAALWRAVSVLPRQQRDALLWREFGGLSYDELATALGVSGAAVESLLFRARRQLRGELRTAFASVNGLASAALAARNALGWLLSAGGAKVAAGVSVAVVAGTVAVVEPPVAEHRARPVRDAAAPTAVPAAARALPTRAPAAAAPVRSPARLRVRVRAEPAPAPTAAPRAVVHEAEPSEREHGPARPESKDGGGDHGDTATVAASLLVEPVSSGGRAESGDGADSPSSGPGSDRRQEAASGSSGDSPQASESSDSPGPGSSDGSEGG